MIFHNNKFFIFCESLCYIILKHCIIPNFRMTGLVKNPSRNSFVLTYNQRQHVLKEQHQIDALELNILRSHVELNDLIRRVSSTIAVCEHWQWVYNYNYDDTLYQGCLSSWYQGKHATDKLYFFEKTTIRV